MTRRLLAVLALVAAGAVVSSDILQRPPVGKQRPAIDAHGHISPRPPGPSGGTPAPTPPLENDLLDDLVAYWSQDAAYTNVYLNRFDSGSIARYMLADNNTVGSAAGMHNLAALFAAASNESLSQASNLGLVGDESFSAAVWFRTSGVGISFAQIIGSYDTVVNWILLTGNTGDQVYAVVHNGVIGGQTAQLAAASGSWHLAILTHNAGTDKVNLYIDDGTVTDEVAYAGGLNPAASGFRIGYSGLIGNYYDGRVDEVGVWLNRALIAGERTELWNAGAGKFHPFDDDICPCFNYQQQRKWELEVWGIELGSTRTCTPSMAAPTSIAYSHGVPPNTNDGEISYSTPGATCSVDGLDTLHGEWHTATVPLTAAQLTDCGRVLYKLCNP